MFNHGYTIAFAKALSQMGIDLATELEMEDQTPNVEDYYAILSFLRTTLSHGVDIGTLELKGDILSVTEELQFQGALPVTIQWTLSFNKAFQLVDTHITFTTLKNKEHTTEVFPHVDLSTLVPVTALLSKLTNWVFDRMFNSDYDPDMLHMLTLDVQPISMDRALLINGQSYTLMGKGQTDLRDQETGLLDFFMLQAAVLDHQAPGAGAFDFTLEEGGLFGIEVIEP